MGDYLHNRMPALFVTNFSDDYNTLYRPEGALTYNDVLYATGLAGPSIPYVRWGTAFFDYDNDGWPDLLVVNRTCLSAA